MLSNRACDGLEWYLNMDVVSMRLRCQWSLGARIGRCRSQSGNSRPFQCHLFQYVSLSQSTSILIGGFFHLHVVFAWASLVRSRVQIPTFKPIPRKIQTSTLSILTTNRIFRTSLSKLSPVNRLTPP